MKNYVSRKRLVFTFSIVTLLILGSISSFGTSADIFDKDITIQKTDSNLKGILTRIKTTSTSVRIPTIPFKGSKSYALADNIVVSNATGNESYPSMVMEGNNSLVAYEYEDASETHVLIRESNDYGQTWSDATQIIARLYDENPDIEINSPSLSMVPNSKEAYGVYTSPLKNSAVFGFFKIDDISDLNNIKTKTYEWTDFPDYNDSSITYDFWDFKNPEIVTYKDTTNPWVVILIGSTNYTYKDWGPCTNSPMFFFSDLQNPEYYDVLIWFPGIQNCSNISISRYYDSSVIYGICEINNDSNQDLIFFKGNPYLWYYGEDLINQTLTNTENLTHPQIFVEENHIYIVTDSDSNGIVLYNSSDEGNTWDINHITRDIIPPSANPNYPMLYANEKHLFCSFIESGNISLTRSTDYGLNWSVPVQLNSETGSVVEEYRFADFPDKLHVLWTDNRNGNNDIYSNLLSIPPYPPIIYGKMSGKAGREYEYTFNTKDPDGDDVKYHVDWGDTKTKVTDYNPSGADVIVSHTWTRDGVYTITARAEDEFGLFSPEVTKKVIIPRNRIVTNTWYQWLFERFPVLERLLSLIKVI